MPAVVSGQLGYRGQQAIGAQPVHQGEIGVSDLGGVDVGDVGDVDDVEQAVPVQAGRDTVGQVFRHTLRCEFRSCLFDDGLVITTQPLRHARCQCLDHGRESVDLGADGQGLRTVVEQPASGTVDQPTGVQRQPV